jgi:hypothetical protein
VTLADWIKQTQEEISEDGAVGAKRQSVRFWTGMWRRVGRMTPNYGTKVFEEEWDVLVVLDACRYDLMEEVQDEYEFTRNMDKSRSIGASSPEWMRKNFTEEWQQEMSETIHVSANPFTESKLDPRDWLLLDEVWKENWEPEIRTIPPSAVTDHGIHHYRDIQPDKMILHYMQPHRPFISEPICGTGLETHNDGYSPDVWDHLRDGMTTVDEVWPAYRKNLEDALDSVEVLLNNIDAEDVVITADHGNFKGEWGMYGHPIDVPLPTVRNVPWIRTSAVDNQTRTPDIDDSGDEADIHEKLKNLGYR